ncbi:hypothetical protein AJ79_03412 [Helicocarpus griseus UAMH5409]|uniref:Uncharacterized protein n=1 Tax=Helicocarpus griseus UAMH5409 TaxID=1447875 RepID=A0A2B7XQ00_9EURO|nr:hypothetical protein AJ79_03412 [Helicocarpus griseus UAMH5409]
MSFSAPAKLPSQNTASATTATTTTATTTTATVQTRHHYCSHCTVTREYLSIPGLGRMTCQVCKKAPDLGWLYACTEDRDRLEARRKHASQLASSTEEHDVRLNDWIEKAIEDGHYTPEQVELMKAQKSKVLETAYADHVLKRDDTPETEPPSSQDTDNDMSSLEDTSIKETSGVSLPPQHRTLANIIIPLCFMRTCPGCLTTVTDRSWVSLNRVCRDDYMTNEALSETLASVAASMDHAFDAKRPPEIPPRRNRSTSYDIADAHLGEEEDEGPGARSDTPSNPTDDDTCDTGIVNDGSTEPVDADNPSDNATIEERSFRDLLHLEGNMTGNKNRRRHSLYTTMDGTSDMDMDTDMDIGLQMITPSSGNQPSPNRAARPGLARRPKYDVTVQHIEKEIDGNGDLGIVSINELLFSERI